MVRGWYLSWDIWLVRGVFDISERSEGEKAQTRRTTMNRDIAFFDIGVPREGSLC